MNFQELTEEQLTFVAGGTHTTIKQGNKSKTNQYIENATATSGSANGSNTAYWDNSGDCSAYGNGGVSSAAAGNTSGTAQGNVVHF